MSNCRIYKNIKNDEYYDDTHILERIKDKCSNDEFLYWVNMNYNASDIYDMENSKYLDSKADYLTVWNELRDEFIEENIQYFCELNNLIRVIDLDFDDLECNENEF